MSAVTTVATLPVALVMATVLFALRTSDSVCPPSVALTTATPDRSLLLALPPLAALAAFTLPTLGRSVSALIDWFTLLFFTSSALVIWGVWISLETGVPRAPAANVARLAPGFSHAFSWPAFLAALAATAAWLWLVHWRVGRHRAALWKSLVLPAGGAALCWLLLMTLWLPTLDYARSYRPMVASVRQAINGPGCVEVADLSTGHIAALRHHANLDLVRAGNALPSLDPSPTATPLAGPAGAAEAPAASAVTSSNCPWRVQGRPLNAASNDGADKAWRLVATVRRPGDARDQLLVYRRELP
jgi:4-amino-4-deoxy-L-arabinose transferase-like glycosyltransferase